MASVIEQKFNELDLVRTVLTEDIKRLADTPGQDDALEFLADMRKLPVELLKSKGLVYSESKAQIEDTVDRSFSDCTGFTFSGDNIFRERFIIPIPDYSGKYCGMAGYDADSEIKYLFTSTMYFNKRNAFYNADQIANIYKDDYVILVEGFFDSIRLTSIGLKNNLASMGVRLEDYHKRVLSRIKLKILLGDGDEAGQKALKFWARDLASPDSKIAVIHIKPKEFEDNRVYFDPETDEKIVKTVKTKTKDIDAVLKFEPHRVDEFKQLIKKIIKDSKNPFYRQKEYWF